MALTTPASSTEFKERLDLSLHGLFWSEFYFLFSFAKYTVAILALGISDALNALEFICCFEDENEHLGLT